MKDYFELDLTVLENTAKNLLKIATYSLILPVFILFAARIFNFDSLLVVSKIGFLFCVVVVSCGVLLYCLFLVILSIAFLLYIVIETIKLIDPKKDR